MGDVSGSWLLEDGVCHGMAKVASQVDGIKRGLGFQLSQRNRPIQRNKASYNALEHL
jgi:hypothetical protein